MILTTGGKPTSQLLRKLSKKDRARRRSCLNMEQLEERWTPASVIGLTDANALVRFDTTAVGTVTSPIAITGLLTGEAVLGVDFRAETGVLYGVTSEDRLVTINTATGAATLVANLTADPSDLSDPFVGLEGTSFGVDFNPVVDRLRVTSNLDQNLRIDVTNGLVITDTDLSFAAGDVNVAANPSISAVAYSNNFAGTGGTTLYGLDSDLNALVTINPPNAGALNTVGTTLGVDIGANSGFEIITTGTGTNVAYANTAAGSLVSINLTTGVATTIGAIGSSLTTLRGLAIVPAGSFNFDVEGYTVNETTANATITVTRTGGSLGAVAVNYTVVGGTATAGADFDGTGGVINFADGQLTQTISVPIFDDMIVEGNETILLTLTNASGDGVLGLDTTATITIQDNESPTVVFYAIADGDTLLELDPADPTNVIRTLPLANLDLVNGETIVGIDIQPSTTTIYGLAVEGTTAQLVTINPRNGAVVRVGSTFTVSGTDFGFDFNPVNGQIRVVSDTGINLSINPDTGVVTTQTPLNPGSPDVVAVAYTNSFDGAGSTTLYVIDSTTDTLSIQLTSTGTLVSVGSLGIDATSVSAFEIAPFNNTAYAMITVAGDTDAGLYSIDLLTGDATLLGPAPVGGDITGFTSLTINDQNYTADQQFVTQLYIDVLGRLPEAGGLAHYVNTLALGLGRELVATQIVSSTEAIQVAINDMYQLYLDSNADVGGLNFWTSVITNGGTYEAVAAGILGSPAYFSISGGTNLSFVQALYVDVLGREVDASGQAYFLSRLANGATREEVAAEILASEEAKTVEVNYLYDLFLDEDLATPNLDAYVDDLLAGARLEDVAIDIAASEEYYAQFAI
jgi:hypothetical protein